MPNAYLEGDYDTQSKFWTVITGLLIAGIFDWYAVVIPHGLAAPHPTYGGWWKVAFLLAEIAPLGWLIAAARRRSAERMVIWLVVVVFVAIAQFVLRSWGSS